jgi:hypothetical protein
MGYFLAAAAAMAGSYLVYDAWEMSLRTETIYQQIYVMIRMGSGMVVFMLACILWALCVLIENGRKAVEGRQASAPAAAPVAPSGNVVAEQAKPQWGARQAARDGWICSECGKDNSPGLQICRCGTMRGQDVAKDAREAR